MPHVPPPLAPLTPATSLDDVVTAIDSVIDWSIENESRLGYFAALYKRITVAVRTAVAHGVFDDGPRMERLDVAFANRYFDALNGRFHPDRFPRPTRSWRVTFDAADSEDPIILQHMFAGVSAHICLDLGIAAHAVAPPRRLPELMADFNRINAVLASQMDGLVADLNELSPALADVYAVFMDHQIVLINEAVRTFRDDAWRFATFLAAQPAFTRPVSIRIRDQRIARQGRLIFEPPGVLGLIDWALETIAAQESWDVAKNIRVLDEIVGIPAPIATTL